MHGRRIEALGQRVAEGDALLAIRGGDGGLDQFVGNERAVGFSDELRCDACVADARDWFERVRPPFQPSASTGGERCRHPPIVVAVAGQTTLTEVISCNEEHPASAPAGASAVL
jgi:hypothetical protein